MRADIERVLDHPGLMSTECVTPNGLMTVGQHIDEVASADMVPHGWDLARAPGQDAAIDPAELERMAAELDPLPPELLDGPGIVVYGPEIALADGRATPGSRAGTHRPRPELATTSD
jgi:hypothetical protein